MISVLAALAALGFAGFTLAQGFWILLLLQVVTAASAQALLPLGESRTLSMVRARGLDYGRIRLWGSVSFVVGVLGIGGLLDLVPLATLPWILAASLFLTLCATLALPRAMEDPEPGTRGALKALLADRPLRWVLVAAALIQASHAAYYAFSAIAWKAAGLSTLTIGILWTEGVLAEIAFFAVSRRLLARISLRGLLIAAALGGLLRWSVTAFTVALPALALIQLLHAATFAAAHLAAVHFIAARAPKGLAATGQGLYAGLSGVAMGAMMLAAGPLYDRFGLGSFGFMVAVCALALAVILVAPGRPGAEAMGDRPA